MDNKEYNKPNIFKQAMYHSNQPKQKEVIQAKYDSFIENKT